MKTSTAINVHKILVIPVVLGFMWYFHNWSVEAFVYLALHGTYSLLWLAKQELFPDRRFDEKRPAWISIVFIFLPLAGYYVAPCLLISRHIVLPPYALGAILFLYIVGIFLHYVSDAQKYYTLQFRKGLITEGLFQRTRNPNYLGEILIYCAFSALSAHWAPFLVVGAWAGFFFVPSARKKDKSLSRYPEFAEYKSRSGLLLPRLW